MAGNCKRQPTLWTGLLNTILYAIQDSICAHSQVYNLVPSLDVITFRVRVLDLGMPVQESRH